MKITFVLPHAGLAGGIRVVAIYAERLQKRGHQVFVVSLPRYRLPLRRKAKRFLKGEGWPADPPLASHFDGLNIPHRVLDSWRPVVDADVPDADVIVATWWETAEWVANLSPTKGAKVYFIQHYETHAGQPVERVKATWTLPLHKVAISRWLSEVAATEFADPYASLVPNSVDTKQFYAPPRSKQSIPTVGLLYSHKKWKGCDVSLAAFAQAAQQIKNLRLIAFGEGKPSPALPLPAGSEYFHQPEQDSIKDIYSRCDVWLCGSWTEGFCLPPLEAMACRCPVVSTQVGGLGDFIRNGIEGYLVPPGNADALAQGLIEVLSRSQTQWRHMSDAAYAAATQYSWDDATSLFEQALHMGIARSKQGQLTCSYRAKSMQAV